MKAEIRCDGPLLDVIRHQHLDTVDGAFLFGSGELLDKPRLRQRQRKRLTLTDESGQVHQLYMKCYDREPLLEALRRVYLTGRITSRAEAEVAGIDAVRKLGIETMTPLVWAHERSLLGQGRSFLLVTAVSGDALERTMDDFLARNADAVGEDRVELLTAKLADLVGRLHAGGYVHRDLYASHVFLDESDPSPRLALIDLARVFRPNRRLRRWRVKDLAQLKYSMPAPWVADRWAAFLAGYQRALGQTLSDRFDASIDAKVAWMQRRAERKSRSIAGEGAQA